MITRIIQHGILDYQGQEDYVLKFEKDLIKIRTKDELIGGLVKDYHTTLIDIYNHSSIFILEELPVKYKENAIIFAQSLFSRYEQIELGMLYMDLIGNTAKHSIYGQRYTSANMMNKKPPVAFINKKMCPGIPMSLDQQLLSELMQKSPILYYPGEYIELI